MYSMYNLASQEGLNYHLGDGEGDWRDPAHTPGQALGEISAHSGTVK